MGFKIKLTSLKVIGFLGIASFVCYCYYRMKELFQGVYVLFLTKQETSHFLLRDEDGYNASLSAPDLYARKMKSHEEYRIYSAFHVVDFTEEQKQILEKAVEKAHLFFQQTILPFIDKQRMGAMLWKIALTKNNTYEDGLPHTRADIIFLTPKIIALPEAQLVKTLIHERVHIYQRVHQDVFQQVLQQQGYKVWRERKGYPLIRSNPDLDRYIYQTPTGEIMVTVYTSAEPHHIQDTMQPNDLKEHPYEEIAYTIANKYIM